MNKFSIIALTALISLSACNSTAPSRNLCVGKNGELKTSQPREKANPIVRLEPRYPDYALRRQLEGFVDVQFSINQKGSPANISIVRSEPEGVFEEAALKGFRKWKYRPACKAGVAMETRFVERIYFKL